MELVTPMSLLRKPSAGGKGTEAGHEGKDPTREVKAEPIGTRSSSKSKGKVEVIVGRIDGVSPLVVEEGKRREWRGQFGWLPGHSLGDEENGIAFESSDGSDCKGLCGKVRLLTA